MITDSARTRQNSRIRPFDWTMPCLVIAPLFEFPLRSGDNILIHNRWSNFSRFVPYVDVVGHDVRVRYINGRIVSQGSYNNTAANKYIASLKVILKRSHYLVEKYLTKEFNAQAVKHLRDKEYGTVVYCYIWTTKILSELQETELELINQRFQIVETINNEVQWYQNIRKASPNPLVKLTAWLSEHWIKNFLLTISGNFIFAHLTNADHKGYLHHLPNHIGFVAPIGANISGNNNVESTKVSPDSRHLTFQLLFVGSLNVQMNFDALIFFKQNFYPHLHKEFGSLLKVTIVGKQPTRKIKKLCREMSWELLANVSEEQLKECFEKATFSILPFSYTSGAKLKLLDSVAHGVPFLATSVLAHQLESVIYPCLYSDSPLEWLQRMKEVGPGAVSKDHKLALQQLSKLNSWDNLTVKLLEYLKTNFHE